MGQSRRVAIPASNFQPWLTRHTKLFLKDFWRSASACSKLPADEAVASAKDRSILGVMQVISLCKQRKAELAKETQ